MLTTKSYHLRLKTIPRTLYHIHSSKKLPLPRREGIMGRGMI
jgi:hypothetical protein